MKRIIALLLAAVTLGLALVSCASGDDPVDGTSGDTTKEPSNSVVTTNAQYATDNPEMDFGEKEIRILSRARDWVADEIWSEGVSGDPISDAVFSRNSAVEKTLNIIIENDMIEGNYYAVPDKIKLLQQTNDTTYDFFANAAFSTVMYTDLGLYANLNDCEYLELDKPWFSQSFINTVSCGDATYAVTGSLALSMYRFIFATFFNKDLIGNGLAEDQDLYEIVNNGQWTIDFQMNLAEKLYSDSNGDGIRDESDYYGFITSRHLSVDPYWSALSLPIVGKTEDNWFELILDTNRLAAAVDKIIDLYYSDGTYFYTEKTDDAEQADMRKKFAEKGAAMSTLRIIECESAELRDNKDYGIIPMPKFSEKQKYYYSYAHDQISAFGIVSWADAEQLQRAGAVLNEMSRQSLITVQPAYYELALKSKYLNDPTSWAMLDMIVQNLYLDPGTLYSQNFGTLLAQLRNMVKAGNNLVGSTITTQLVSYERKIEDYVEKVKDIQ